MIRPRFEFLVPVAVGLILIGCAETTVDGVGGGPGSDEEWVAAYGVDGGIEPGVPAGKEDTVSGPSIAWERTDTVWAIEHQWSDITTEAGLAWGADSGLTWEQKFEAWVQSLPVIDRGAGGRTFEVTSPHGVSLPAPVLECAEVATFLRAAFASWHGLPFYLRASSNGSAIYLGHFGFRNANGSRFRSTPNFRNSYRDYTSDWEEGEDWPSDSYLRRRGLYGGGDEMAFLPEVNGEPARAGAYVDALFLNKRVGHFMLLALSWFGSMNLASDGNMFHITPESIRAGDVLLHRWQRNGIGHTLPVMRVDRPLENRLVVALASGSMPRRQPVWEEGAQVIWDFTSSDAGGPGETGDGDKYAALGGGIRRWRVATPTGRIYTNSVGASGDVYIRTSDVDSIAARTGRFNELLQAVSPEAMRDAALARVEAARSHLSNYPASCSARERRERAFESLYDLMADEFGQSRAQVDAENRELADYVFAELEYTESRSCCWNSSTHAMYEIVMAYVEAEQAAAAARGECLPPTVFKGRNNGGDGDGFQIYAEYARTIGRGGEWVAWSADESCPQRNVRNDTERSHAWTAFCDLDQVNVPDEPDNNGCNDGNDTRSTATALRPGRTSGKICPADRDVYRIELRQRQAVAINVLFRHADGDLDMVLNDAGGSRVALSQSSTDNESVNPTLAAGVYYLEVYGWNDATGNYTVELSLADGSSSTCGDGGSSVQTAVAVDGSRSGLRVCGDEADYWRFSPIADGRLRVTIDFSHSVGDLDMAVYRAGDKLGTSQGTSDEEKLEIDVRRGQEIVIHVYGYSGATGDYSLSIREI